MATIGLKDVHYALLIKDDPTAVDNPIQYGESKFVKGAMSANINPNTSSATLFEDDGPGDVAATLGEITLELNLSDIPLSLQAIWLGHTFEGGVLKRRADDVAPWLAIGFKTLKSNGAYRYMWLGKGKFAVPEEDYQTKGDSVEFKTPTITGAFAKRISDGEWERVADADEASFIPSMAVNWFKSPIQSFSSTTAPGLSVTVAAGTGTGTTKATITGSAASGNHYAYKLDNASTPSVLVDTLIVGATTYTSGGDIAAAENQVLHIYELTSNNLVVKYFEKTLASSDIKV